MSQTFASVENRVVEALRAQGRRSVAYQLKRKRQGHPI